MVDGPGIGLGNLRHAACYLVRRRTRCWENVFLPGGSGIQQPQRPHYVSHDEAPATQRLFAVDVRSLSPVQGSLPPLPVGSSPDVELGSKCLLRGTTL